MTTNQKSPGESTPAADQESILGQAEIVDVYKEAVTERAFLEPAAASGSPPTTSRSKRSP